MRPDMGKLDRFHAFRGFLHKNLGRPWDSVYSEICQTIDRRSNTGRRVIREIGYMVEKNCFIEIQTKKILSGGRWGRMYEFDGFYVHPQTGILCEQRLPTRRQLREEKEANTPITKIKISETERHEKVDGVWYYIEEYEKTYQERITIYPSYLNGHETEVEKMIKEVEARLDGIPIKQPVVNFITKKKQIFNKYQLNSKELKEAGLKNDFKPARPLSRRESRRRLANG